ncbi:MAG: anaerobic ribonucleoside-triphosphate reductase activating protein [Holosporales bacterium]|jgi:pyruvate formate lyase activating enzyme|nr:anaerobic ribonucleoside-triphosphate reductase activating protein [Holosporales bacterium]
MLKIAAILRFSALDYPSKLSAVVFCQGCPLRCKYCHNYDFIDPVAPGALTFESLISFLKTRRDQLEAVVFSGGEPLMQPGLIEAAERVREMGFLIGLHTAGTYPDRLANMLKITNWTGFDIKTSFARYSEITQIEKSGLQALASLEYLLASGVDHELRTTYDPRNISDEALLDTARTLKELGATKWVIQECILRDKDSTKGQSLGMPSKSIILQISEHIGVELRRG